MIEKLNDRMACRTLRYILSTMANETISNPLNLELSLSMQRLNGLHEQFKQQNGESMNQKKTLREIKETLIGFQLYVDIALSSITGHNEFS